MDASTDEIVGSAMLSAHWILQNQRDQLISRNGASLLQFLYGPLISKEKIKAKLELREGLKDTFGLDFLIPRHEQNKRDETNISTNRGKIRLGVSSFRTYRRAQLNKCILGAISG